MNARIRHLPLDTLVAHPDNPNRMGRAKFAKLVRNIERTGRYEPLIVRPCPGRPGLFQIINGRHRCEALRKLGRRRAEAVVWDVNDEQTDILLATLNRLSGRDSLEKKSALLRRLHERMPARRLARLLPQTRGQLERLTSRRPLSKAPGRPAGEFALPVVFFVSPAQQQTVEEALSRSVLPSEVATRAARRAEALTRMARHFLEQGTDDGSGPCPAETADMVAPCT